MDTFEYYSLDLRQLRFIRVLHNFGYVESPLWNELLNTKRYDEEIRETLKRGREKWMVLRGHMGSKERYYYDRLIYSTVGLKPELRDDSKPYGLYNVDKLSNCGNFIDVHQFSDGERVNYVLRVDDVEPHGIQKTPY